MTFTEAALVVMEREGRPMHSREIAEKAVEQGILSHVGKTPVQTMSGRLWKSTTLRIPLFMRAISGALAHRRIMRLMNSNCTMITANGSSLPGKTA